MKEDLSFKMSEVSSSACAPVVEDCDGISAGDEGICQVRADEAGTTGDESAHEVSLSFNGLPSVAFQEVLRKVRDG